MSEHSSLAPSWINSDRIWSMHGNLYLFSFSITISTFKQVGSGTNGSGVCISIIINVTYIPSILIFYEVGSRLATLCRFIYAIYMSDIFVLPVCFKLITFVLQIFSFLFLKILLLSQLILFRLSPFTAGSIVQLQNMCVEWHLSVDGASVEFI